MSDTDQVIEQTPETAPETTPETTEHPVSPENLPPELQSIYKSMQADYTKKTQALAEERKRLTAQPEQPPETDGIKAAAEELLKESMPDFDPENPAHAALVNDTAKDMHARMTAVENVRRQLIDTARAEPRLAEVDNYAARLFAALPEHEQAILRNETAHGNTRPALAFWQDARRKFYTEASRRQHTPAPPKAAPASASSAPANPAIAPSDFRTMSDDDKARSLVKLGLV